MTEPLDPLDPRCHVDSLKLSLAELVDESQALRADMHAAERARRRENRINLAVIILLCVFVALIFGVAYQNNAIAHQAADTNRRIADCTTSTGTCYRQSGQRTGQAIGSIIRAEIALGECSRLYPGESGPDFDVKLQACVYERIATDAPTPIPTPTPSASPSPTR